MRISDWSSDVCSSDLEKALTPTNVQVLDQSAFGCNEVPPARVANEIFFTQRTGKKVRALTANQYDGDQYDAPDMRSEEHTSELQSLMRISYTVFCLKKKTKHQTQHNNTKTTHRTQ